MVSNTNTGTITTQNLVPAGAATAGSAVEVTLNESGTLGIQVVGTYTGALSLQATNDGTNWITVSGNPLYNANTSIWSSTIASATQGLFVANVAGFLKARISGLAAMTGTATVTIIATAQGAFFPLPTSQNTIGFVNAYLTPNTTIGFSTYHTAVAAASGNPTSVKTSAGVIGMISVHNKSAGVIYLKIFNKASAPTMATDTPVFNFGIPAASVLNLNIPAMGLRMSTGIAYGLTGGQALLDNTALVAGDAVININYT
jgi:hypothetical protein